MPMQETAQMNAGQPKAPRSIDFHNPGTAAHVAGEIEENYRELLDRRELMNAKWDEECAGHNAALEDINYRIDMATAALSSWERTQPQEAVPAAEYARPPHTVR